MATFLLLIFQVLKAEKHNDFSMGKFLSRNFIYKCLWWTGTIEIYMQFCCCCWTIVVLWSISSVKASYFLTKSNKKVFDNKRFGLVIWFTELADLIMVVRVSYVNWEGEHLSWSISRGWLMVPGMTDEAQISSSHWHLFTQALVELLAELASKQASRELMRLAMTREPVESLSWNNWEIDQPSVLACR